MSEVSRLAEAFRKCDCNDHGRRAGLLQFVSDIPRRRLAASEDEGGYGFEGAGQKVIDTARVNVKIHGYEPDIEVPTGKGQQPLTKETVDEIHAVYKEFSTTATASARAIAFDPEWRTLDETQEFIADKPALEHRAERGAINEQ